MCRGFAGATLITSFFSFLRQHLEECLQGPKDDLHQTEDGEATEEAQSPAHVGDEVEHGHGGRPDDALGQLVHHVETDQVEAGFLFAPISVMDDIAAIHTCLHF